LTSGERELRGAHGVLKARGGVEFQIARQRRLIHLDQFNLEIDTEPHGAQHVQDTVEGGDAGAVLDARDGRLGGPGQLGHLALAVVAHLASLAKQNCSA